MTKAQAAETLKEVKKTVKGIEVDHIFPDILYPAAIDKAIEVLSDKTEYVKRSTYRKLKAELYKESSEFVAHYGKIHQEKEELQKHYDTLVADASELKMVADKVSNINEKLEKENAMLIKQVDECFKINNDLIDKSDKLKTDEIGLYITCFALFILLLISLFNR